MASTQEIKRRIKAVTNTGQITKAMEMVSATKMRRSQEIALLSRPYAIQVLRLLSELSRRTSYTPEIMKQRPVNKTAIVLVTSDKGLAGAFNTNVFRVFDKKLRSEIKDPGKYVFIAVGKKAEEYLAREKLPVVRSFKNFGDYIETEQVRPLTELLIKGFLRRGWDRVIAVSTHFRSTLRQDVLVSEVLPVTAEKVVETIREIVPERGRFAGFGLLEEEIFGSPHHFGEYKYLVEPDPKSVLEELAPQLVEIELYDLILEANASEHSARMVAMKNASENALELKDELTLEFNKLRQAGITREITEIVSGAEALKS